MPNNKTITWTIMFFFILTAQGLHGKEHLSDKVEKPVKESIDIRQKTQKQKDQWSSEKRKLEDEFNILTIKREELAALNKELKTEVQSHNLAIKEAEEKIDKIDRITDELLPYLFQVAKQLEETIETGLPFLEEERKKWLEKLFATLDSPTILTNEKFRKILEALQIEAEYGINTEVYQARIKIEEKTILANIFRLGRLALFFQTIDKKISGIYNPASKSWSSLPRKFNTEIGNAMDIAEKRRSNQLLTLPLGKVVAQ